MDRGVRSTIHRSAPPGYVAEPWVTLGMTRQNWYQVGFPDLLDSWQVAPNTPRLYRATDVGKLKYWLFVRRGQIALGLLNGNAPMRPDFDLGSWFDDDYYGAECPKCNEPAVADPETGRLWCEACGEVDGG